MSDADREARILELRRLVSQGEYRVDPSELAARLVDEHVTAATAPPPPPKSARETD